MTLISRKMFGNYQKSIILQANIEVMYLQLYLWFAPFNIQKLLKAQVVEIE